MPCRLRLLFKELLSLKCLNVLWHIIGQLWKCCVNYKLLFNTIYDCHILCAKMKKVMEILSRVNCFNSQCLMMLYGDITLCQHWFRQWPISLHINIYVFSCDQAALWLVQSVCLSVRLSVCLSVCHTFFTMFPSLYHHEIFRSYYHGQKWCPCKR